MTKNASINVRLSSKSKERLARLAEKEDSSMCQIVRLAIDSYLAEKE